LLTLIAAGVATVFLFDIRSGLVGFVETLQSWGGLGLVLLAVAYVFATIAFFPGSILTVGAGYLAKVLWPDSLPLALLAGTAAVSIGSVLGATAAFVIGRTLARGWVAEKVSGRDNFRRIDEAVGKNGLKMVFLLRLSPVFPFNLLNYALGVTKVRFRDYVLASWIGMLPGTVLYVYLGTGLQTITAAATGEMDKGAATYLFWGIGLLATVLVVVLVTRVARRAIDAELE
jgi:uncharacterized membrane protein YdjX (TVP38/TMEM64 family)